jgi:hypothetical protein
MYYIYPELDFFYNPGQFQSQGLEKTKVSLILKGSRGCGENAAFRDVKAELLAGYCDNNVMDIKEVCGKFNAGAEDNLLVVCNRMRGMWVKLKLKEKEQLSIILMKHISKPIQQGQGQPFKYEISQLIISKIKASADWKAEVKDRVTKVIKDGKGTRNGNAVAQQWIQQYCEVERKKRKPEQFQKMRSQRQGAPTRVFQTQQEPNFTTRQRGQRPPAESVEGGWCGIR